MLFIRREEHYSQVRKRLKVSGSLRRIEIMNAKLSST